MWISLLLLGLLATEVPARPGPPAASPAVVKWVAPEYTEMARKARRQGTVAVRVEVGPLGEVRSASIEERTALPMGLSEASLAAARQWRFAGDAAAMHEVRLEFSFSIYPWCEAEHVAETLDSSYHVHTWARSPQPESFVMSAGADGTITCRKVVEPCP